MSNITITYDILYEILRLEKTRRELQELNKDFFKNLLAYLQEKYEILNAQQEQNNIFSKEFEKTQKQLKNTKRMIKEIYERRESKIIQLALYSSRIQEKPSPNTLLPEEKEFLISITKTLNNYRRDILYNILKNKPPEIIKQEIIKEGLKNKLIRFTHTLPRFVGDDLNTYGPYEEEDVANLPENVATVLINRKKAQEIKA